MSLKQQMNSDLDIFLNSEEFADVITVSGQEYKVIIDKDGGYEERYIDTVITCKHEEFKNFLDGQEIIIDSISYKIHNKSPNLNGMMEIALVKN